MTFNKTKYPTKAIIKWLWKYHKGCRLQAFLNIAVGLLLVACSMASVDLVRRLTDVATHKIEGDIVLLAILLGSLFLVELGLHIASTWISAILGVRTQNRIQQKFFSRILAGRWNGISNYHSGDVLNRLFGDVSDIVRLMTEVLPSAVIVVIQFIWSFTYLYIYDAPLALVLVIASPIFLVLSRIYFHKMRRIVRKIKDSNSAIQSIIQESIQHKMVIKVLERNTTMVDRLEQRQGLLRKQIKSRAHFSIISKSIVSIGFSGAFLAALIIAIFQVYEGLITVGVLMSFMQLTNRIQQPLLDMARLLPTLVNSMTSSERLMELEELPLEETSAPVTLTDKVGIRFKDISYSYSDNGRQVINHFSHDFLPGSFTAILGETGAGKTTLIRMMLSLINPSEGVGELYSTDANGNEVTYKLHPSLRNNFSYIPQGNTLFSGTIRENLLFGNPKATTADMEEALHLALADFVLKLPDGLDTKCGEGGGGLSEGQAQRISIARALLHPCKVLLLDEATSALDMETEKKLLINLKEHYNDCTIIFVTHRLAVVDFTTDCFTMVRQEND